MASSTPLVVFFRFTLLLLLLLLFSFCITINSNNAGGGGLMREYGEEELGSRPPLCKNRCMSCRPCMATLVPFPRGRRSTSSSSSSAAAAARHEEGEEDDESYYLLAWKCQCGNKLFQP